MTYSADSYESPSYGVGCETTSSIMGEWIKYKDNPLFQSKDENNIHPCPMHIEYVTFENIAGVDKMNISKEYITPELI